MAKTTTTRSRASSHKRLVSERRFRECEDALDHVIAEKERAIERLAEHVRKEIVVPACVRYGLTYTSGNGSYVFGDPAAKYGDRRYAIGTAQDARDAKLSGLADVFRVLDMDVDTASRATLGHYVRDVRDLMETRTRRSEQA